MLTLRDLRRLAKGRIWRAPEDWQSHMYGRLVALPDEAQPVQRSQMMAALFVATEIVRLRRMDLGPALDAALDAVARGDVTTAAARLKGLDETLSARLAAAALRVRGSILAMTEALTQHAAYFEAGVPG
jgi:hypothetical protein